MVSSDTRTQPQKAPYHWRRNFARIPRHPTASSSNSAAPTPSTPFSAGSKRRADNITPPKTNLRPEQAIKTNEEGKNEALVVPTGLGAFPQLRIFIHQSDASLLAVIDFARQYMSSKPQDIAEAAVKTFILKPLGINAKHLSEEQQYAILNEYNRINGDSTSYLPNSAYHKLSESKIFNLPKAEISKTGTLPTQKASAQDILRAVAEYEKKQHTDATEVFGELSIERERMDHD
ncbi:hypothetical protein HK097_000490 [Rhizophlyctis rosea]|uniref:Uncharacterized protein n=1 Tax=Rhizophlyctis rosea TaxID=64517 RepID=A0AAD5S7A5_9FUNG|nr:hypothetical protein HK097_000490 [Rhizophlyctis rosea]